MQELLSMKVHTHKLIRNDILFVFYYLFVSSINSITFHEIMKSVFYFRIFSIPKYKQCEKYLVKVNLLYTKYAGPEASFRQHQVIDNAALLNNSYNGAKA